MFWSCKVNQIHLLKRHRTFKTAAKKAGDSGVVYSEEDKTVKQIFKMTDGSLKAFDTVTEKKDCYLSGFNMIEALRSFDIIK